MVILRVFSLAHLNHLCRKKATSVFLLYIRAIHLYQFMASSPYLKVYEFLFFKTPVKSAALVFRKALTRRAGHTGRSPQNATDMAGRRT